MEKSKFNLRLDEFGIQRCPQELWDITPKHPKWQSRVKFEIEQVLHLHNHYKKVGNREWIKLAPSDNPNYNFMIWNGQVWVPDQPEIRFDFRILLTSEYPKVMPRWYIDQ